MDMPEHIQILVDQLGEALVEALVNDPRSRLLAAQLQACGYDLALGLEATVGLRRRDRVEGEPEPEEPEETFSEDDRAFLRKFKIRLD